MRHSCESDMQTQAEARPSFLGWRKLCVPFCCLCDCSQHKPCLRTAHSLCLFLEPNCCVGSLLQRLQCPTAQDLTSSVLSLLTMHSTVPIPKMTGCVDFNMFHIVSASFCIKKTIEPVEHDALCGGGANVQAIKPWQCLYGLHVLTTVGGRTKMQIVQNHDEKRLQTWYFDFCYL